MKGTLLPASAFRSIEIAVGRAEYSDGQTWTAQTVADLVETVRQTRAARALPITSKAMLGNRIWLLQLVQRRLDGKTTAPDWSEGLRVTYTRMLRGLGLTLITSTAATKRGLRVKRGAQPIATGYFGAPIQRQADLFIAELQCSPVKQGK